MRARKGLKKVVEYLETNWSEVQIRNLENDIESLIERIKNHNFIGIESSIKPNTRKGRG